MVLVSTALENFITVFNLIKNGDELSFNAEIYLKYGEKEIQVQSKVVITNGGQKKHNTLYLLSSQLITMQFPEVFRSDQDFFSYYSGKYLIINGMDEDNTPYVVLIHPRAQVWEEE